MCSGHMTSRVNLVRHGLVVSWNPGLKWNAGGLFLTLSPYRQGEAGFPLDRAQGGSHSSLRRSQSVQERPQFEDRRMPCVFLREVSSVFRNVLFLPGKG